MQKVVKRQMEDIHISEQIQNLSLDTGVDDEDDDQTTSDEQNQALHVEYLFHNSFLGIRTAVKEPQSTGEYKIEKGLVNREDNSRTDNNRGTSVISVSKVNPNQKGKLAVLEYSMTSKPRGIAVIIAIENFDKLHSLVGTPFDIDKCKNAFESLHFKVEICKKSKAKEIIHYLQKIANRNHSMYDCFILYVSSHGGQGFICCSDFDIQREVKVGTEDEIAKNDSNKKEKEHGYIFFDTLLNIFLSSNTGGTLVGKPKLFFFDCCRTLNNEISKDRYESPIRKYENNQIKHEYYADIFIGYATLSGDMAGMDDTGSAYTKILTDYLTELVPKESFVDVMTQVTNDTKQHSNQMPHQEHTLCKRILMRNLSKAESGV